jgi:SEC-C motif-containing protein
MHASAPVALSPRRRLSASRTMPLQPEPGTMSPTSSGPPASSGDEAQTKQAIRELLDVLPKDVLDELNSGAIDLKDPAFLDGLMDHVSRLSLANPRNGQKILGKVIKLKKLIAKSLRQSNPEVVVSATVTRSGERIGRNAACPCGSGKKYKQCCLRKK